MKKIFHKFRILFCGVLACGALTSSAMADGTLLPERITLDKESFSKHQILLSFLDAAFTKDTLNENSLYYPSTRGDYFAPVAVEAEYPWFYPFMYPKEGTPRLQAINKWVKSPQISIGMPNDLNSFLNGTSLPKLLLDFYGISREQNFEQPEKQIRSLSKQLSEATGLNISYLPHEQETQSDYAGIRINFFSDSKIGEYRNSAGIHFISFGIGAGPNPISFRDNIEPRLKTAFVFAKSAPKQVDGYFLTNAHNEIQMAVCYIWIGHTPLIMNNLLSECLIRAMGLPGVIDRHAESPDYITTRGVLTYWNEPEKWQGKTSFQLPDGLSDADKYQLKTLYNPALKPGMDYIQAQKILLGSEAFH